jgi:BASS family bile acid:Na+ symporter
VFAYLGRGNIALSISLTVTGTFASMATVPLLLTLLATEYVPPGFMMPVGQIVLDVVLWLLMPLAVGMTVARLAPEGRLAFSRWCIRLGFVVVAVMVTGSIGSGRVRPTEYGWRAPLAIILFTLVSQQLSMLPFRLWGWPRPDCLSVGMEVTMRNLNLAFVLKALLFPATELGVDAIADGVLFVILYYAGVAMACGAPLALRYRWMARRAERRAAEAARAEVPT